MAKQESAAHSRAVLERMAEIIGGRDFDALEEVLHPDFVQEMPQSGERVVGIANFRKILEQYPGPRVGLRMSGRPYIAGSPEHYIVTPTFNVVKVEDNGDELTSYVQTKYPDDSDWFVISFTSFKDGKVIKRVDFFAPFFDAPEWRSEWVEKAG
jgi:ketosteroid isomerase-like protein